jgi:hypothetical protein
MVNNGKLADRLFRRFASVSRGHKLKGTMLGSTPGNLLVPGTGQELSLLLRLAI